jgi:cob(I)alamin adenosyltransferase
MGHRLSRIYTRTGDGGSTGLGDGSRVAKTSARIQAIGDVDELNCLIGVLLSEPVPDDIRELLVDLQHALFDLGGELSIPQASVISADYVARVEAAIDRFNAALPPLKEFILPGGSRPASLCQVARAVCRRAERTLITLDGSEPVNEHSRIFLNRVSDLLFVVARVLARQADGAEVYWDRERFSGR